MISEKAEGRGRTVFSGSIQVLWYILFVEEICIPRLLKGEYCVNFSSVCYIAVFIWTQFGRALFLRVSDRRSI